MKAYSGGKVKHIFLIPVLDEENRGRYREGGIGLESTGARRRGRPRKTWKKTVEEEAAEMGKTWKERK
jgi:hypothetical protein